MEANTNQVPDFAKASRLKLRFDSSKGLLTVEDLWDLPLTSTTGKPNLDDVARALHKELKNAVDEVSFVTPVVKTGGDDQLKFDIVRHVIGVRVIERDTAAATKARAEQKQKLLEILDRKQNAALEGMSEAELRAEIEKL